MKCAAYGCKKKPGRSGLFCAGCWRRLPEELRGPAAAGQAVVWLARKDGYLAAHNPVTRMGSQGRSSGYV